MAIKVGQVVKVVRRRPHPITKPACDGSTGLRPGALVRRRSEQKTNPAQQRW
jgi:hypothetical protein